MRRAVVGATGLLLLVFGLACLNNTKASALEHHREVAQRNGLPSPSENILYLGVAFVVIGSGSVGYAFGKAPRN